MLPNFDLPQEERNPGSNVYLSKGTLVSSEI
jgi:hypothetical protein